MSRNGNVMNSPNPIFIDDEFVSLSSSSNDFEKCKTNVADIKNTPEFEEPKIAMEFTTTEAAYDFYNKYAFHIGFSIRKNSIRRNKKKDVITMRGFTCSKEGLYREKLPIHKQPKHEKLDTRTGCEAHLRVNLGKKGVYAVTSFQSEHNHSTASPSHRKLLNSQRRMNESEKAIADLADSAGLKPKQTYDFFAKQAGGREHLGFLPTDYKNYLRSKRTHAMALGDAGAVMQYLQNRVKEDPAFYYAVQLDEDDQITNIFWADGRSLLDYDCFGDVIVFDSTYKTNSYGRPFAPFVGVNHHKQTVVFGAALLYDEKISSFEWVFQTFTHAVGGKAPKVVLIDQDAAMAKAIANVWPNAAHRICVWHMYQNAAKHLSHVFSGSKSFEKDFSYCVYDCEDEEDFLEAWGGLLVKYELSENKWLHELFENREKWALVYGRQVFCADMKSTQRSESLNSVIKRYLDPKQRLLDFFNHYERLLEDRRHAEMIFDNNASQGTPRVQFSVMLKQAASILTPSVFKIFKAEYGQFLNCSLHYCGESENAHKYRIVSSINNKRRERTVWYNSFEDVITCSCMKFQFVGIQCCHVLKVLDHMNIKELPEQYYLKRWRKDAKSGVKVPFEGSSELDPKVGMSNRYGSLLRAYNHVLSNASRSQRAYSYAFQAANKLMSYIERIMLDESREDMSRDRTRLEDERLADPFLPPDEGPSKMPKGIRKKDGGRGKRRYKSGLEANNKKAKNNASKNNTSVSQILENPTSEANPNPNMLSHYILQGSYGFGSASDLLNAMHVGHL